MTDLRAAVIEDVAEVFRAADHEEPFATLYATHCLKKILATLADTDDIPRYPSETGYRDVVYTTADGVTAAYLIAILREQQ